LANKIMVRISRQQIWWEKRTMVMKTTMIKKTDGQREKSSWKPKITGIVEKPDLSFYRHLWEIHEVCWTRKCVGLIP
jgi:hypothetical protein